MPVVMNYQTYYRTSEKNYYEILGITANASAEEIRRAYHNRAFEYHPDRNQKNKEANEKMREINEAYTILSDPIRRREYDLPRGYCSRLPKFKNGDRVKISADYPSPFRSHTGIVDKEPVKDTFRFWYMVKIESKGLIARFAEEELEEPDN